MLKLNILDSFKQMPIQFSLSADSLLANESTATYVFGSPTHPDVWTTKAAGEYLPTYPFMELSASFPLPILL